MPSSLNFKKQTLAVNRFLKKEYPVVECELNYSTPLELLVATILSAQCTDKRVNMVTPLLFASYRSAADFGTADFETLAQQIRSTGFYNNKAKNIINASKMIVEKYGAVVPDEMQELIKLPGVARKTANVVLGSAFAKNEGIAVDTHVMRLSKRLALTDKATPEKIEADLMDFLPRQDWSDFSHRLIRHGRRVCQARKPLCTQCGLLKKCNGI